MAAKVVWAIDIGQTGVRAVKAAAAGDRIEVLAFDSVAYKEILSAPGVDKDNTIQQALRSLKARNHIGTETIAVAIPGQSALVRFIKLPPVERKRIPDIVRYEAHQQIPFPLEEVVWAYKPMEKGIEQGEQVEVGIFAMRRDIVNRFLSNLIVCDIDVDILQLAPMALYNMLCFDQPPGVDATLLLDAGAENTELLLASEGSVWPRSLPVAGNDMTEAIMEKFKVPYEKAETLKQMAKQSKYSTQIYHAIEPVLKRFVEEIQRSLGFYRSINPGVRVGGILALGGAFRLPGMAKYLSENLRLPIRSYTEPQNFDLNRARNPRVFQDDPLGFGVALGLAVQALGYGTMDTSLLPPEVLHRKLITRKKPYAAAVAVVAVLALGTGLFHDYQQGESLDVANRPDAHEVKDDLKKMRAAYKDKLKVADIRLKLEQATSIWEGRDLPLSVLDKLFKHVREEPWNEKGVWLIKVVLQRVPFEVAAQKVADGESRSLGTGLKGPPLWEENPRFDEDVRNMLRTTGRIGIGRTNVAVGGPGQPGQKQVVKRDDIFRVVVVGETTHPDKERYVDASFLQKLEADKDGPRFIDALMLTRSEITKYIGPKGQVVTLDKDDADMLKNILEAERRKQEGMAAVPGDEKLPEKKAFLRKLNIQKGIKAVDFLQFTAALFVDAEGHLMQRVDERKKEATETPAPGGILGRR